MSEDIDMKVACFEGPSSVYLLWVQILEFEINLLISELIWYVKFAM